VANIERSIEFYKELFGMAQACPVFPIGGELYDRVLALEGVQGKMCVMVKGSFHLELFEFAQPQPARKDPDYSVADRGLTHFGVEVTDIEGTYSRMLAAGVRFHSPVTQFPGGMKATYGRDPDGNVFELLERGEVARQG
jgi:catechol 2,3-dioxygenase-like lactoylglutathione lyase family enzyme